MGANFRTGQLQVADRIELAAFVQQHGQQTDYDPWRNHLRLDIWSLRDMTTQQADYDLGWDSNSWQIMVDRSFAVEQTVSTWWQLRGRPASRQTELYGLSTAGQRALKPYLDPDTQLAGRQRCLAITQQNSKQGAVAGLAALQSDFAPPFSRLT